MTQLNDAIVSRVKLGSGVSTKSGTPKPYQIAQVTLLVPARDYIQGDHNIRAHGYEEKNLSMVFSEDTFAKFKQLKPLQPCTLIMSPDPENPARNIVSDFKQ